MRVGSRTRRIESSSEARTIRTTFCNPLHPEADTQSGKPVILARSRHGTAADSDPGDRGPTAPTSVVAVASRLPERLVVGTWIADRSPRENSGCHSKGGATRIPAYVCDRPRHERRFS